jgi:hypothetical protein
MIERIPSTLRGFVCVNSKILLNPGYLRQRFYKKKKKKKRIVSDDRHVRNDPEVIDSKATECTSPAVVMSLRYRRDT